MILSVNLFSIEHSLKGTVRNTGIPSYLSKSKKRLIGKIFISPDSLRSMDIRLRHRPLKTACDDLGILPEWQFINFHYPERPWAEFLALLPSALLCLTDPTQKDGPISRSNIEKWWVSIFAYHFPGPKDCDRCVTDASSRKERGSIPDKPEENATPPGKSFCQQKGNGCKSVAPYANPPTIPGLLSRA